MATENQFIWDTDEGITITHTEGADAPSDDIAAEIAKIDAILREAGEDPETFADAALDPSPLYVSRKLLNADAVLRWARAAGIKDLEPAGELHVTICYSRAPVDWLAMGQPWDEKVEVGAGGPRLIMVLGESSVVLAFAANSLQYRHDEFRREGASWDYEKYIPHVTLSKTGISEEERAAITPYQGVLVFGPELFEELDHDDDEV